MDFFHTVVVEGLILHITFIYGTQQMSFVFGQVKLFEGPGGCKKLFQHPFHYNLHSAPVRQHATYSLADILSKLTFRFATLLKVKLPAKSLSSITR